MDGNMAKKRGSGKTKPGRESNNEHEERRQTEEGGKKYEIKNQCYGIGISEGKERRSMTRGDSDEVRKRAREQKDNSGQVHCQKARTHTD